MTDPGRAHLPSLDWAPLVVFPVLSIPLRPILAPWIYMWILAGSLFFAFKWRAARRATDRAVPATLRRRLAFLFLWPGMDAVRGCMPEPPS